VTAKDQTYEQCCVFGAFLTQNMAYLDNNFDGTDAILM